MNILFFPALPPGFGVAALRVRWVRQQHRGLFLGAKKEENSRDMGLQTGPQGLPQQSAHSLQALDVTAGQFEVGVARCMSYRDSVYTFLDQYDCDVVIIDLGIIIIDNFTFISGCNSRLFYFLIIIIITTIKPSVIPN